jgi:hypothetical protein
MEKLSCKIFKYRTSLVIKYDLLKCFHFIDTLSSWSSRTEKLAVTVSGTLTDTFSFAWRQDSMSKEHRLGRRERQTWQGPSLVEQDKFYSGCKRHQ